MDLPDPPIQITRAHPHTHAHEPSTHHTTQDDVITAMENVVAAMDGKLSIEVQGAPTISIGPNVTFVVGDLEIPVTVPTATKITFETKRLTRKEYKAELSLKCWKTKQFPPHLDFFSNFDSAAQLCEVILERTHDLHVRGAALAFLCDNFISSGKINGSGKPIFTFLDSIMEIFEEFAIVDVDVITVHTSSNTPNIPVICFVFDELAQILGQKLVVCWEFVKAHVCAQGFFYNFVATAPQYLNPISDSKEALRQLAYESIHALKYYGKYREIEEKVLYYYLLPPSRPIYQCFEVADPQSHAIYLMMDILPKIDNAHTLCQVGKTCKWLYNHSLSDKLWEQICSKNQKTIHYTRLPGGDFKKKYERELTPKNWYKERMKILINIIRNISKPEILLSLNNDHNLYRIFKEEYNEIMASRTPAIYAQFITECPDVDPNQVYVTLMEKRWYHGEPALVDWLCCNYPSYRKDAHPQTIRYLYFQKGTTFLELIDTSKMLADVKFMNALKEDSEFCTEILKNTLFLERFVDAVGTPALMDAWKWYDYNILGMVCCIEDEPTKVKLMYRRLINSDHMVLNLQLIKELGKYKEGYDKLVEYRKEHHPKGKKGLTLPHMEKYEEMIESSPFYQPKECVLS
eukprot:Phypoly_transcript_04383.p1 GENE.Phypoly_transcript_04383~~Phypoly_transcript_04383.p1  ORF type:complete len:631 (+),score=104.16 Phypoly_transcript_04383:163-2055(+)